jgi:hypothetical protein
MAVFGRKSRKARRKVERQAWLSGDQDFALRPCTVLDMHDEGARLRIEDAGRVPSHFNLTFSRTTRAGRRCEVRWRRGHAVGVTFVA